MPKPPLTWSASLPNSPGSPLAAALGASRLPLGAGALSVPVATVGDFVAPRGALGPAREVLVRLQQAPLGTRVFLESQPASGPSERIQALALPARAGHPERDFLARLPVRPRATDCSYLPVAAFDGSEVRGTPLPASQLAAAVQPRVIPAAVQASPQAQELPFPSMELIAHVEAELPKATVFGPTPDGLRIAFYIADGQWRGPHIHAHYRAEGGDWLVVRKDGVGLPSVRATLETDDGALLYYELTGSIDMGPEGYERALANDLSAVAPFSAVARISTASEKWSWLNRIVLMGAGVVNLQIRRAHYDLYSMRCDPAALR
jgi:hypothetical protein